MVAVLLNTHLSPSFAQTAPATKRPNIIIMLADDMGYSDLGCYGSEIHTPNLDSLAQHGLRFTQFYNTGRCCPTRAALLTGLYQHQAGVGHMVGDHGLPSYQGYLNEHCVTIAEALRPAGYQTLMSGKWHVGSAADKWPRQRGFQRYFGCPTGGGFYFAETMRWRGRSLALDDAETPFPDEKYITDLFTDYAIQFVQQAHESDAPFFLYLAHIAPHWPLQAKPQDIEKYRDRYSAGWNAIRNARFEKQKQLGLISEPWSLSEVDSQAVQAGTN
ncbi:MAG: sulfatase-like hydrolase/transferase [Pirellulaceae bacterium]